MLIRTSKKSIVFSQDAVEVETTTEKKPETTTTEKPKEKCKENSCDHICTDEDGKVNCRCREGFRLQADKKSCKGIFYKY